MLFMVVEHFAEGKVSEIYRIAREEGRHLPDGLRYVDSWVAVSLDTCFQLMECDDLRIDAGMGGAVGRVRALRDRAGDDLEGDVRVDGQRWRSAKIRWSIARVSDGRRCQSVTVGIAPCAELQDFSDSLSLQEIEGELG